jgi:hypothetical protein
VWRLGEEPDAPWVLSSHPRHAHIAGFDLHANVAVPAADRARLEQLCRYLLRPPVAQDRLRRMGDDRILLTLKTPWADGTRHLLFAPMELLEKLAAFTPRPRINLILYHGVLAPHAGWRARAVAYGALPRAAATAPNPEDDSADDAAPPAPTRHWAWANLMRRAFDLDVLACPRCGRRLRLLGTIEDPVAIRAILDNLAVLHLHQLVPAGGGRDRDPEQERITRRGGAVEPAEQRGGDRDAGARRAGNQRERLRDSYRHARSQHKGPSTYPVDSASRDMLWWRARKPCCLGPTSRRPSPSSRCAFPRKTRAGGASWRRAGRTGTDALAANTRRRMPWYARRCCSAGRVAIRSRSRREP